MKESIIALVCLSNLADGDECKLFVNFGGGGLEVTHPFGHYWLQIKSINFISSLGLCFDIGKGGRMRKGRNYMYSMIKD